MKAIITVGIPCSGKTAFAEDKCKKDRSWVNINRDDLRFSLTGTCGWKEYKFNKHIEKTVTEVQKHMAFVAAEAGKNVIISDTNINPKTRDMWKGYLKNLGFSVEVKDFPVSLEEAWKRDALRPNGVGKDVIYSMYLRWLDYSGRERYEPSTSKARAVVCDIDGTLAHMNGRSPFEWHRVGEDSVDPAVHLILEGFHDAGRHIILLSGRDGICRPETEDWLSIHKIPYTHLYMRPESNNEKDTVIKERMFFEHVAPHYYVTCVIDDRPSVCRMWRELGLKVIQVGDPHLEF